MAPTNNTAPFHIIGAPLTVYLAPFGTEFPAIDEEESEFLSAEGWFKFGSAGDKDYDEAGVTVTLDQTLEYFRGAGSTLPRKAFRTEEDVRVGVTLADLSPEQFAKAAGDAELETVPAGSGAAGYKKFSLYKGLHVATFALLARGPSPVMADGYAQYQIASVVQDGSPAPVYTKGSPALLEIEFRTIDAAGTGEGIEHVIQTEHAE